MEVVARGPVADPVGLARADQEDVEVTVLGTMVTVKVIEHAGIFLDVDVKAEDLQTALTMTAVMTTMSFHVRVVGEGIVMSAVGVAEEIETAKTETDERRSSRCRSSSCSRRTNTVETV